MDQTNQGNNFDTPVSIPAKRKRGRPRKDKSSNRGENVHAPLPRGFEGSNGSQPHQVDPVDDPNDVMVGQLVSGVVEAAFDAGYLLTVRLGDSDTSLRGVVFKPGHYVPVSAENDVAPHMQMIRRNEISLRAGNQPWTHSHNSQSTGRNEQHVNLKRNDTDHPLNEPRAANFSSSEGKQVPMIAAQPAQPVASRGGVVPVVLQPVHLSNGTPSANEVPSVADTEAAAHVAASKSKQVPQQINASAPTNEMPIVTKQLLLCQPQTCHPVIDKDLQNETRNVHQTTLEVLHEAEAKSIGLSGVSFETLPGEDIKRIQVPPETQIDESADHVSADDSGLNPEGYDIKQPFVIQPVQPDLHSRPVSVSESLKLSETGKMTEPLQENINEVPSVQLPTAVSHYELFELRSVEPEHGDVETDHSEKCPRASNV